MEMVAGWHAAEDENSAADQITRGALTTLVGAAAADITRPRGGRHRSTCQAPTDDTAAALGRLHANLDDSPSGHALQVRRPVEICAMAEETRWCDFTAIAGELGVASMLCLPLRAADRDLGTLNLYACTPAAFRDRDTESLTGFGAHAALALYVHAERAHLGHAVESRDRIGQAKGVLMVRHQLTAEQAFGQLVAASQAANMKLIEVADWLIAEQQHRNSTASQTPVESV